LGDSIAIEPVGSLPQSGGSKLTNRSKLSGKRKKSEWNVEPSLLTMRPTELETRGDKESSGDEEPFEKSQKGKHSIAFQNRQRVRQTSTKIAAAKYRKTQKQLAKDRRKYLKSVKRYLSIDIPVSNHIDVIDTIISKKKQEKELSKYIKSFPLSFRSLHPQTKFYNVAHIEDCIVGAIEVVVSKKSMNTSEITWQDLPERNEVFIQHSLSVPEAKILGEIDPPNLIYASPCFFAKQPRSPKLRLCYGLL